MSNQKNKFTILGCGSSLGSPWITNYSAKLKKNAKDKIIIMPGSGINKSNIMNFKSFNEIHGSFKDEINTNILL